MSTRVLVVAIVGALDKSICPAGQKGRASSMTRSVAFLTALTVSLAIAAAPAFAQTSGSGYSTPAGQLQAVVETPPSNDDDDNNNTPRNNGAPAQATQAASGSQLPFTGLDVGLLLGAGVALLLVGATLSRLTRSASSRTE